MRMWCNGSHAGLKNRSLTGVRVRLPPSALYRRMGELADPQVLEACAEKRLGASPSTATGSNESVDQRGDSMVGWLYKDHGPSRTLYTGTA